MCLPVSSNRLPVSGRLPACVVHEKLYSSRRRFLTMTQEQESSSPTTSTFLFLVFLSSSSSFTSFPSKFHHPFRVPLASIIQGNQIWAFVEIFILTSSGRFYPHPLFLSLPHTHIFHLLFPFFPAFSKLSDGGWNFLQHILTCRHSILFDLWWPLGQGENS